MQTRTQASERTQAREKAGPAAAGNLIEQPARRLDRKNPEKTDGTVVRSETLPWFALSRN